jgi:regulator of protease activity HflC (stomatin/prohibitin superfamily)
MDTKSWICVGVCVAISITVIMLLVSMDSIEPLHYGITYNKITKSIGTEVYENGRYLIGPIKGFLDYPSNLQTIEFSDSKSATSEPMLTRTSEGLALTLFVSFQFQIMRNEIPKLYNLANTNYFGTYVRISRDTILKIAGQYNATSNWTERTKIGDHMLIALDEELQKAYAKCITLQILKVDLPNTYEDSIVQTQVEVQKTNMRKFEQQAELIRQNISVIRSEAEQQIRVTNSTANAEAYRIKQFASVFNF